MISHIPTVNWPPEPGEYKIVQIYLEEKPYLRFNKFLFHSHILEDFLNETEIEFQTVLGKESSLPIPAIQGNGYHASGMGKADVNVEERKIRFYGESGDYGIKIDRQHLDAIRRLEPDWTFED